MRSVDGDPRPGGQAGGLAALAAALRLDGDPSPALAVLPFDWARFAARLPSLPPVRSRGGRH